jgi:hypothetical protein
MSDGLAHPLHPGTAEMDTAVKRYIARCILLLPRELEVREAFTRWANERFQKSEDPVLLLHENPLHFSARYLALMTKYANTRLGHEEPVAPNDE